LEKKVEGREGLLCVNDCVVCLHTEGRKWK